MPQLQVTKPYASGTPTTFGDVGTSLSTIFTSLKSYIPFISSSEPVNEGVYTDFLGNPYEQEQNLSGLSEEAQRDRVYTQSEKDPSGQSGGCAWWNLPCKAAAKVSEVTASAGEFVSSTLTKTLIIVVVVGTLSLFLMSYVQTKGQNLAK